MGDFFVWGRPRASGRATRGALLTTRGGPSLSHVVAGDRCSRFGVLRGMQGRDEQVSGSAPARMIGDQGASGPGARVPDPRPWAGSLGGSAAS